MALRKILILRRLAGRGLEGRTVLIPAGKALLPQFELEMVARQAKCLLQRAE
jgi:hypothetical protein